MKNQNNNWLKYIIGFTACLLIRLIPFRAPNIEPILATQMPFAKNYGKLVGFSFGFLSIVLFDIITLKVGEWTFVTAFAYGFLGLWASNYFKNRKNTSLNYVKFAIMGTIAYDIVTGLTVGPIFFNQPLIQALMGQIPFTLLHLAGNITFALLLSPLIDYALNKKKETRAITKLNPKYIS